MVLGKRSRKAGYGAAVAKRRRRFVLSRRRVRRAYRGRGSLARVIKSVSLKNSETKYRKIQNENVQLYHNAGNGVVGTTYYMVVQNLLQTQQGLTQSDRIGDAVHGVYLKVKLWLSNKSDRPNVMYRVAIITMPADQTGSGNPTNLFRGDIGNKMLDYIDTDRYKVIAHKIIQPMAGDYSLESGATNREHSRMVTFSIPLKNRKVVYNTDNGLIPRDQRNCLGLMVIPYDAYGTLTTDNIASMSYVTKFYFKDP